MSSSTMARVVALVLALMVTGASGGGLLISSLLYESQATVDHAIGNLLAFTISSTQIVVHLSPGSTASATKWVVSHGRLHLNADPQLTCSACGMVTRQHAANVRYAARVLVLDFDGVALFASTCRLFAGGGFLERHAARHAFSTTATPAWAQAPLTGCARKDGGCERCWNQSLV